MLRIVLPITLSLAADIAVEVVVAIEIIIVVDVDISAVPIAIAPVATPRAPSGRTQRNSRAPHQSCPWHVARISIGVIRIRWGGSSIHHSRVVRGNIDNIGVRLLNFDHLLAAGDCLRLDYRLGAGF